MSVDLTGRRVLDRYVVDSLLASGGMGTVWRAHHEVLGQPVAIKVVTQAADEDLRQRIAREARVMAMVRHPHVVSILDAGLHDGAIVIAMEWLDGETLGARLERTGAMPWRTAAALCAELALGLSALHRVDLIHRDLKPLNVMLCGHAPEVVKLLDLGLARPVDPRALEMKVTAGPMVLGTPAYMAPEQLLGQTLDARADLYALGLVLYELVTGSIPWDDPTLAAAYRRTRDALPRPVSPATLPDLPLPFLRLMSAMLAVKPEGRPVSALVVAQALRELAQSATPTVAAPAQHFSADDTMRRTLPAAPPADATLVRGVPPVPEAVRVRQVVVASVPASRLSRPLVRKGLAAMLRGQGRSFTFGERLWFALVVGSDARECASRADALCVQLRAEFGSSALIALGPVDEGFELTTGALTGQVPLPASLQRLIDSLDETTPPTERG